MGGIDEQHVIKEPVPDQRIQIEIRFSNRSPEGSRCSDLEAVYFELFSEIHTAGAVEFEERFLGAPNQVQRFERGLITKKRPFVFPNEFSGEAIDLRTDGFKIATQPMAARPAKGHVVFRMRNGNVAAIRK